MLSRPLCRRVEFAFCTVLTCLQLGTFLPEARAQTTEEQPPAETPEVEVEPSPIPGAELPLIPQEPSLELPSEETLGLRRPLVVEPILPALNFDALGRSGRLWSFHGVVKDFRFFGNHAFSNRQLGELLEKYKNREITAEDLEQARQDLTLFYINQGYVNSGAILPDQDGKNGVITFHVIEGKLSSINVTGNFWFRPWWLRNEIRRGAGRPLNFNKLKESLQLLRQNPTISRINAELKPGGVPGESILDVDIKDTQPFRLAIEFDNKRPPSVGAEIVQTRLTDLNVTGHNDLLELIYGIAHTTRDGGFDFSGTENMAGNYVFPITPWATTLQVSASKSDTSIIEEPFAALDIKSELEQYGGTIRQPIYRTLANEVAVSATAERRRAQTFLFGLPFSLSPGAVNGVTSEFVTRFGQEFVNRNQTHVLALRSTFNVGLDAFDATNSGSEPDSEFFSWLGQSQYVHRLWNTDNLLVLRLNGQFAASPLFALEQFVLGGSDSVRGYRENQVLRDNGVFGSIEVRVPVWYGKERRPILMLAPFFDIGSGWNTTADGVASQMETLPSAGIGLMFDPSRHVHAQIYWGYAFNRDLVTNGSNLQDYGIHFAIAINAF
jgi:hemolysin activation/secretion protein